MDAAGFRGRVESERATELDRLGSDEFLVALTDATLDVDAVLRAAADSEHAARVTFAGWADDEADAEARDLFSWVADREADHRRRVLDALDGGYDPADGGVMHAYLRGRDDAVERVAAGLVGRPLVSVRTHRRIASFFADGGDETRSDLFRELHDETAEELERGLAYLDTACEGDDWERARMVAEYVIRVAYDDHADSLARLDADGEPVG